MSAMKCLLLLLIAAVSNCQRFDFPSSPSRSPGLQVDRDGKVYASAGSQLYRLNSNLQLEESRILSSEAVNISLSSDGRWLVVCLTDLSCEVYNATNFSVGHVFRRENATTDTKNIVLFAAEDSFYVGGISVDVRTGVQQQMVLGQYGFTGNRTDVAQSQTYTIERTGFERNFHSGFVRENYAYYFAVDNNPRTGDVRAFKVLRVCHNSNFSALYELSLGCAGVAPASESRISGISVVEDFAGTSETSVVLSRNRPGSTQNFVCLFSLQTIDNMMQEKFTSCSEGTTGSEQIDLSWGDQNIITLCTSFQLDSTICCFDTFPPLALDDIGNSILNGVQRLGLGSPNANFITASVAVIFDSFSFIFVAFIAPSGNSFIIGFDASATGILSEDDGFDRRPISNGPVRQLQWQDGADVIYAITNTSVIQISVADCSSQQDCSSCLGNSNPLCGWCVVENKCSKQSECQNSEDSRRWIQAAGSNTDQCPTIMVSPEQYVMDNPQIIALTLSWDLPILQENETYLCHFARNVANFTVPAVGSGATYTCNITGSIPTQYEGLATVLNVSLVSSLRGIPFSTNVGGLTIYRCSKASSCSQCLQTNNACGWCVYNKVCSGTISPCVNRTKNYLQPNLAMSETFADVCPLLDQPSPGVNYTQPVLIDRNIELVSRNLPPEIAGFSYTCQVGSVNLQATYNNETSLTCSVDMNTLTLPSRTDGQEPVDITIRWMGSNNLDHPIDAFTPVSVILYNCAELADSCSSCLGSEFECRWCGMPKQAGGSCAYSGPGGMCDATLIAEGSDCADPSISDFNPKSGPRDGGTTINITGTDLGVTFSDFTSPGNSIRVGDVNCTPTNPDNYIPGQRISCTTTSSGGSTGAKTIHITLPNGAGMSITQFNIVSPQITGVFPPRGPQAGGTQLTVYGTDLNIGNIEETRITLVGGTECTVNQTSIQATNITCTTVEFTASAPPVNGTVMVMINSATVSNNNVQYMYTANPEFYSVIPSNTILGGGIELIFNGTNLDVVQSPTLVVNDPEYLNVTNSTLCEVISSMAISCVTPPLNRIQQGDDDGITYTIRVDNAPGPDPLANASLQIRVLPNPGNFRLVDTEYNSGSNTVIRIMGENLGSVTADSFVVTVNGELCNHTTVLETQINCEPPSQPPGGIAEAIVVVNIGQYLSEILPTRLRYNIDIVAVPGPDIPLAIIIPVVIVALLLGILLVFSVVGWYHRKVRVLRNELGWTNVINQIELNKLQHEKKVASLNPQVSDDRLLKLIPEKLLIPSSQLKLFNKPIGQGEFGVVYKAQLINLQGSQLPQAVAVKTAKGLFSASDVEGLIAEISKMMDFQHPNVMSLIGVCLDAGPGVSIVMPFMANGSLLDYLKKERASLYLSEIDEIDEVIPVRKLLLRMCYQIAQGMEYLTQKKFIHRDLAARNCMLDYSGNVSVGDFGLAEDVYTRGYFRQGKNDAVKLPFKWMAPESLRDGLFSEKSDVWSFGVTCWEVFSAGRIPYSGVDAISMLKILEKGTRLEKPENIACAPEYFSIMMKCWALNPEDRPGFEKLSSTLGKVLEISAGYLELSMVLLQSEDCEDASKCRDTEMHTCEVIANHLQEEECLSRTVVNQNQQEQEANDDCTKAVDFSMDDSAPL